MSELWNSMCVEGFSDPSGTKDQEILYSQGVSEDPGWGAYDEGVEVYSHALRHVLGEIPLQQFIASYCQDHQLTNCSVIDYMGTGVVRNLEQAEGVSVSLGHPPGATGNYIDGNLFFQDSWNLSKQWLKKAYGDGKIAAPYFDISISRPLLGTSRMRLYPELYGMLLRRAYRLMNPERGILISQIFVPKNLYGTMFETWKEQLANDHIELTYSPFQLRIDRHPGSPYNLPFPSPDVTR